MLTLLLAVSKTQAVPTQFSTARTAFNCFLSGSVCLGVVWLPLKPLLQIYEHCDSEISLDDCLKSEIVSLYIYSDWKFIKG